MGYLPRRFKQFSPPTLAVASAGVLGNTIPVPIERANPLEAIEFYVDITAGATGPTFVTGTQAGLENVCNIVKNFTLSYTDADGPHTPVNISGMGCLATSYLEGMNLDSATMEALRLSKGSSIGNNQKLRLCYYIPVTRLRTSEPLDHRCLLPIHKLTTDPILSVQFESAANMFSAGSLASVVCTYRPIYRDMSDALTAAIIKAGGFIRGDLVESVFTVPLSSSAEISILLPSGLQASISNVTFRQYLGGASVTQDVVDLTTTLGSEERWRLDIGSNTWMDWRWKQLQSENQRAHPLNVLSQTSSPAFGGAVAASTSYQPADTTLLDFLAPEEDGAGNDLGSLFDVSDTSKTYAIRGKPASVATNASLIYTAVRRYFGDLSQFQRIQL